MRNLLCGETCPLKGCKAPWVHSAFYEDVYLHRSWLNTQGPYVQFLTPWSPPLLPFTARLCLKHHTPLSWHMLFLSPKCPLPLFPFLLLFKSQLEGHLIHSLPHSFIHSLIHSFNQQELSTHQVHRMPLIPSSLLPHTLHLRLTKHITLGQAYLSMCLSRSLDFRFLEGRLGLAHCLA